MQLRTLGLAAVATGTTFLVVTVAVAEALLPTVAFSILVALPVGLAAGAAAGALVLVQLGRGRDPRRWGLAVGLGAFGAGVLAVFAGGMLAGAPATLSLLAGVVCGVVAGLVLGIRSSRRAWAPTDRAT